MDAADESKAAMRVLDEEADPADLKMYEELYRKHKSSEEDVPVAVQFQYGRCLVRTDNDANITAGSKMLQGLFQKSSDNGLKRDALYYLAIADARLKNYDQAIKYCDGILYVQPDDGPIAALKKEIDKRMLKDGLMGIAVIAGIGVAAFGGLATVGLTLGKAVVGGIMSLGVALSRRK